MSKSSNTPEPKVEIKKSTKTEKFKAEFLTKSDWPKTPKENIKVVINLFLNFFPI